MFVLVKNYELNEKASALVISPLKSIFERQAAGDGITRLSGSTDCTNFPVLFTDADLKYYLILAIFHRLTVRSRSPGVTQLYGLYRYVRPQMVWFFSRFGHKLGMVLVLLS